MRDLIEVGSEVIASKCPDQKAELAALKKYVESVPFSELLNWSMKSQHRIHFALQFARENCGTKLLLADEGGPESRLRFLLSLLIEGGYYGWE